MLFRNNWIRRILMNEQASTTQSRSISENYHEKSPRKGAVYLHLCGDLVLIAIRCTNINIDPLLSGDDSRSLLKQKIVICGTR